MKRFLGLISLCLLFLVFILSPGCKKNSPVESSGRDSTYYPPHPRKPNIYIYPDSLISMSVKIIFPVGGSVIKSIPKYFDGWDITVDTTGLINNRYSYLFYECTNPDVYQRNAGWIVSRDSLQTFFSDNLLKAGFNDREKVDFLEYWIPRLVEFPYYIIYPQFPDILDKVIQLNFSHKPDNILRLFYLIEGSKISTIELEVPMIPDFNRKGFVVAEWGVVI